MEPTDPVAVSVMPTLPMTAPEEGLRRPTEVGMTVPAGATSSTDPVPARRFPSAEVRNSTV